MMPVFKAQQLKPMRILTALFFPLILGGCSLIYHVPISQGNILSPNAVAQLKTGMTEEQVKYLLGTPMLKDTFNHDHWGYVFFYRGPHTHVRQNSLDLFFEHGKLKRIEGDEQFLRSAKQGQLTNADGDVLELSP